MSTETPKIHIQDVYMYYQYHCKEKGFVPCDFNLFEDAMSIYIMFNGPEFSQSVFDKVNEWLNNKKKNK